MTGNPGDTIRLISGAATADIALRGAEPVSWRIGGRELLWSGDPAHWDFRAPILFPRVGASTGGSIQVGGQTFPMPQHGFARRSDFAVVEQRETSAQLRLRETAASRASYPFAFALDVTVELGLGNLSLDFGVANAGDRAMPYAIGFHPAFPWPLDGADRAGHRVVFDTEEIDLVPEVAEGGLLARRSRRVPLIGRELPLHPELFTEALVFLHARSRAVRFEARSGAAITMRMENFPHLAIWSRPDAPFLSLECWTGHADWEDAAGELAEQASMINLAPGAVGRHRVMLEWSDGS